MSPFRDGNRSKAWGQRRVKGRKGLLRDWVKATEGCERCSRGPVRVGVERSKPSKFHPTPGTYDLCAPTVHRGRSRDSETDTTRSPDL